MSQISLSLNGTASISNLQTAFGSFSAAGNNSLVSGVDDKTITVYAFRIQATNAASEVNTLKFADSDSAALSMSWDLNAREGVVASAPTGSFEFQAGSGLGVVINSSLAQPFNVMIQYTQD